MPKHSNHDQVTAYLAKHKDWQHQLKIVRSVIVSTGLDESIKWGGPAYSLDGRVLLGIAAYSRHCAIWFHHGVFLADASGKLRNAQSTTRGMRQWRIEAGDKIPQSVLRKYVKEAIANEKAGKRVVPRRKKAGPLPSELAAALADNALLATAFAALTPGKQREYSEHVASAKRVATREARVQKLVPRVLAGEGLNDRYR